MPEGTGRGITCLWSDVSGNRPILTPDTRLRAGRVPVFAPTELSETDIHHVLSNPRRRATIRCLKDGGGLVSLGGLAQQIAATESGEHPPPRRARESVYNTLHQTHLPLLHDLGVVTYDRDQRAVELRPEARQLTSYMDVVTKYGITWGELYRAVGVAGLLGVVATEAQVPVLAAVDSLLWATGGLAVLAVTGAAQLWSNRSAIRRAFGF